MALDLQSELKQVHALLDQLPPSKLGTVRSLLEDLLYSDEGGDEDGDELTDADRDALRASEEYFRQGGQAISFEEVVTDLGFSMEQIRAGSSGRLTSGDPVIHGCSERDCGAGFDYCGSRGAPSNEYRDP
jgi:hypothetical protein